MFLDEARLSATLTHRTSSRSTTSAPTATRRSSRWSTSTARTCARCCARSRAPRASRARRCRSRHAIDDRRRRRRGPALRARTAGPGRRAAGHRAPRRLAVERARLVRRRRQGVRLRHREVGVPAHAHAGRNAEGQVRVHVARAVPRQAASIARSDIFALGAILYEVTTGAPPFSGASELDILNQIATGRAAPPAWPEAMGAYPPALSEIVLRALAPEPDERFQTMQELQIALESFARDVGRRAVDGGAGGVSCRSCSPTSSRRGGRRSARASRWPSTWRRNRWSSRRRIPRSERRPTRSGRTAARARKSVARDAHRGARRLLRAVRGRGRAGDEALAWTARRRTPAPRASKKIRGRRRRARKGIRQPYRPRKKLCRLRR